MQWPPRVPQVALARLYASEAAGLLDEELLDEVGIALYLRCQAILDVNEALHHGRVRCPRCAQAGRDTHVGRDQRTRRNPNPGVRCKICGWETDWRSYERTFRRRQLNPGGATAFFHAFVQEYPRCASPRERMLAIDRLIHAFHYSLRADPTMPTRPAGVNLIEGRLTDIVPFLDALSTGALEPGMVATRRAWEQTLERWASQYATWAEWQRGRSQDGDAEGNAEKE